MTRVSVVINTLDRAASLDRTLTSLRYLRYPEFEVVVVQGPCSDNTTDVLKRHAQFIRIGQCKRANLAESRNIGVAMARGDIVAFLDDDAVPEADWLDRLGEGFAQAGVAGVGGFIRDNNGIAYQHRFIFADRFGDAQHRSDRLIDSTEHFLSPTGTNIAIGRAALIAVGGFDEEYEYFLEETDLNLRLIDSGRLLAVVPEAEVHHGFFENRVRSVSRVPKSTYLISRSKSYFCWKHASGRFSSGHITDHLNAYRLKRASSLRSMWLKGRFGRATYKRLLDEVLRGIEDGARDARSPGGPKLLSADLLAEHARDGFKAFERPTPTKQRLRLCFISRAFLGPERDDGTGWIRQMARALADRGHEVAVICHSPKTYPYVEFSGGLWIHGILAEPAPGNLRARFPDVPRMSLGFGASAADEIARTRARRDYQVIICPPSLEDGLAALLTADIKVAVADHASRGTLTKAPVWPFLRSQVRRDSASERMRAALLAAATTILARDLAGTDVSPETLELQLIQAIVAPTGPVRNAG
jgi:glycogen(starch) synthase